MLGHDLHNQAKRIPASIARLESYIRAFQGRTAFFDVPLHYKFHNASKKDADYDLRYLMKETLLERRPWDAVTFVDNHEFEQLISTAFRTLTSYS